jgi:O-antigen ligase
VALGGALVMLQVMSDVSTRVTARAGTLAQAAHGADPSLRERVAQWQGTLRAIGRHPLLGLGLGNYVIRQQSFTGIGRTPADVARRGASMEEQAHNEYLQMTAELGLPGLLLYLLMLLAFFAKSVHALRELPSGTRKVLLIGCIAAVAAQSIDALTNPAWRYSVCALYFWLVLGTGTALVRMAYRQPQRLAIQTVPAERALAA